MVLINYVVTFFFLKMPKIWVGQMMLNGEKAGRALDGHKTKAGKYLVQKNQWPVKKTRATVLENKRPFVFFE